MHAAVPVLTLVVEIFRGWGALGGGVGGTIVALAVVSGTVALCMAAVSLLSMAVLLSSVYGHMLGLS